MKRADFYTELRKRSSGVFGTSLSQAQVEGMENLLDVWEEYYSGDHTSFLAYNLGTAYHETAHTMQPITERGRVSYFDKYEPGTRIGKVLGNTVRGDGYKFRGEGHVQNTGRSNAAKATARLNEVFGLGIDLVANPSKRGDPFISAHSLFLGNKEGWWTGRGLSNYITGESSLSEFKQARRVVNGTDKAETIARYALAFSSALDAAGYGVVIVPRDPERFSKLAPENEEKTTPTQAPPSTSGRGWLFSVIAWFAKFLEKRKT